MTVITYLQDAFTRANASVPGTTEVGKQPWVIQNASGTGVWSINTNRIVATANGSESYCVADSIHSDGIVEATMVNIVDGGLLFRYWDTANFWMVWATGGVYKLMKKENGTYTQVGGNFGPTTAGDVVSVQCDEDSINFYVNGLWKHGVSDNFLSWATKYGFRAANSAATYDTFSHKSMDKNGIAHNDPNIIYSPYNWSVTGTNAKTICSGAYFRTIISGNRGQIALHFDTTGLTEQNIIKYQIDGEGWVRVPVTEQVPIPMPAASSWDKHTLEVLVQTAMAPSKWSPQESATIFRGLAGERTLVTHPGAKAKLNIMVFGDSITEGYVTLKNVSAPSGSDAQMSYAGQLRNYIGAEVGQIGFGSTGWTVAGAGAVPSLPNNYKLLWGGGPSRSFTDPVPDMVLINHGTNDGTTDIKPTAIAMINELRTLVPASTIIGIIVPFNQNQKANLQSVVSTIGSAQVRLIDTAGWYDVADSSDGIHPYGGTSKNVLAPKLAEAATKLLTGGGIYLNVGGVAVAISLVRGS